MEGAVELAADEGEAFLGREGGDLRDVFGEFGSSRYDKAHFVVQNEGWFGPKSKLGMPLLYNLRRDPYERTVEEGNYQHFLEHKMWAFGPAKAMVQAHLSTFAAFPSRSASARSNAEEIKEQVREDSSGQ